MLAELRLQKGFADLQKHFKFSKKFLRILKLFWPHTSVLLFLFFICLTSGFTLRQITTLDFWHKSSVSNEMINQSAHFSCQQLIGVRPVTSQSDCGTFHWLMQKRSFPSFLCSFIFVNEIWEHFQLSVHHIITQSSLGWTET